MGTGRGDSRLDLGEFRARTRAIVDGLQGHQCDVLAQVGGECFGRHPLVLHRDRYSPGPALTISIECDEGQPQIGGDPLEDVAVGGKVCRVDDDGLSTWSGSNGSDGELVEVHRCRVTHESLTRSRPQRR